MFKTTLYRAFNVPIKKTFFSKNSIRLNKKIEIDLNPKDGARWIVVGNAGSGKSYLLGIMLSQFKNVFHFDPTGKFSDIIVEQGEESKWIFKRLTPKNTKDAFKMNVRDLHPRILNSLFPRREDTDKKRLQRQAIEMFLRQRDKTYEMWSDLCIEYNLQKFFVDLEWILSPDDSAPSIIDLCKGRVSIDVEEVSVKNPCIGVFLQSLIGARGKLSASERLNLDNFVVVSLDEAQDYCKQYTPVGEAFASLNLQARKYGLGEVLVGSAYDNFHPDVRSKSSMRFIFESKGITDNYKRAGIDINLDDWDSLPKYHCFIFSNDGEFNGFVGGDVVLPDLFYKEVKNLVSAPDVVVKNFSNDFPSHLLYMQRYK